MLKSKKEKILEGHKTNPSRSYNSIAKEIGVTRQYISLVMINNGIHRARAKSDSMLCAYCNVNPQPFSPKRKKRIKYCSPACKEKAREIRLDLKRAIRVCEMCHREFKILWADLNLKKNSINPFSKRPQRTGRFCSRKCCGKFIGSTYGRGRSQKMLDN